METLSQELKDVTIRKATWQCVEDLLDLRLVSRSWRQACQGYAGVLRISCHTSRSLSSYLTSFPNANELCLEWYNASRDQDLTPLSTYSQLSQLRLLGSYRDTYKASDYIDTDDEDHEDFPPFLIFVIFQKTSKGFGTGRRRSSSRLPCPRQPC